MKEFYLLLQNNLVDYDAPGGNTGNRYAANQRTFPRNCCKVRAVK